MATWDWLGEPLALDFANTWQRRGTAYRDVLQTGEDVAEWCRHHTDEVRPVGARQAGGRLDEIRSARDDVLAILQAAFARRALPEGPVTRINDRAQRSPVVPQLGRRAGTTTTAPAATDAVEDLLARVAAATIAFVGGGAEELGFCDAPSCGMFFVRHRPDQRWCGPACGTRARVARHAAHHRRRGSPTA